MCISICYRFVTARMGFAASADRPTEQQKDINGRETQGCYYYRLYDTSAVRFIGLF